MMYQDYPVLSAEQFAEVLSTDKGINYSHFSHGYSLGNSTDGKMFFDPIHKHDAHVWGSQNSFKITDEQQAQADAIFLEKKAAALAQAQQLGTLTFVARGGDYNTTIIGGLGNHRICAKFMDKKGHKWFLEVHPIWSTNGDPDDSKGFYGQWVDLTFEEEEQARFDRETRALIEKYGDDKNVPSWAWHNSRKWPEQRHGHIGDYYDGCTIGGKPLKHQGTNGRKFTANDLRVWINKTFGCNYKSLQLDRYFLTNEDFISSCIA